MLKKISLQALQFAINQAINLDPVMPEKLLSINQKIIEMIVSPLNVHFYICIVDGKIFLKSDCLTKPDTIIHSNPMGLIRLSLLPSSKMRSLFNDQIQISGDVQVGQKLKQIFDSMQVDWEGHLAHFTGDVVAHQIGRVFRKGKNIHKQYIDTIKQSSKDYLTYEISCVPSREEIEKFCSEVDDLRLRTERLSAHVNSLMSKHEKF